jgi:phage terminase large subunit GpA-like protein
MKTANESVLDGLSAGLRPPSDLPPWQWAAKNVKISNSERSSKFDPDQTPWWKGPMSCASDSETRQITVLAPTGSGKSTMAEALIPYIVSEDPGPLLYASQTDSDAKFWAETRLKPAMKSCKQLAALWPEDRHASRKLEIIFPHMPISMGGANISNFQEKSVRWLYGDEVWAWAPGLIREFLARHHNRWNRKVYLVSQAGVIDGDLHQEWKKTNQAEFSWRCECGDAQPFSFDCIKFDTITREDGSIDDQTSAETARMRCRGCAKEYPNNVQTRRMLSDSNMDNGGHGYISTNPIGLRDCRGFHVDSLAIWWISWSQEVLEFLEASRLAKQGVTDKLRQWKQKRRAQFWSDDMADSEILISRNGYTKMDHEDGQPIEGEVRRFATIDAGGDHYWAIISAWRQGGQCRILWEGYIPSDGGDEADLASIIARYNIPPPQTFIDIGYEQDRILDLCVKHGWTGIKGEGNKRFFTHNGQNKKTIEKLYSPIKRARAKSGGVARFIFLASNPIKDILARMMQAGDQIEIPADVSKPFENHMKCERRTVEKHPKTGEEKSVWIRPGSKANHLWDCLCYQVAAALAFRVFDESEDV